MLLLEGEAEGGEEAGEVEEEEDMVVVSDRLLEMNCDWYLSLEAEVGRNDHHLECDDGGFHNRFHGGG